MVIASSRKLIAYRDLDDAYPRPATGDPSGAGWWRQAMHNYAMMTRATAYNHQVGTSSQYGLQYWDATYVGATEASLAAAYYLRVGQICYYWGQNGTSADITATPTGVDLPVEPADSLLPMVVGHGAVALAASSAPFVTVVESGALKFYYAATATDGAVIDGDPLTVASNSTITFFAAYRVAAPPEGYLTPEDYVLEHQYPTGA